MLLSMPCKNQYHAEDVIGTPNHTVRNEILGCSFSLISERFMPDSVRSMWVGASRFSPVSLPHFGRLPPAERQHRRVGE